ncbi:MAG: NHL repeat-containing protein [Nitrosotalea sp.]
MWVSDQGNNRILKYTTPFTTGQSASLVLGHSTFTQTSPGANATALNTPFSLVFDSSGNLWVTDQNNNRILRYSQPFTNNMAASLVLGQSSFTTNTAGTSNSTLNNPANIAFDSSGNLWVADDSNNRVLEYKPPFSNGMAASLVFGQANFTSSGINNGFSNPSASSLNDVNGIAFDKSGNLWVADSGNNRVLRHVQASQNQVLVGNSVTTITVSPTTPQLIVANANANLSTIKIPSTVTDTTINYSNILIKKSTGNSVTLSNALGINANTTTGNFQITFPKNIMINGSSSWSGTVNVATVSSVPSLPQGSLPAISIQVGLGSTKLTLGKAAELVFAGDAGKRVGFTYGGPFTEITQVCSADAATGIPSGAAECKIDVGADLHVWTLHFTTFSVYTTSSGGHGGSAPGAAPSFTTGFSASETPLSIDGTGFNLNSHTNTGTTVTLQTGKPFVLKMLLSGSQGSSDVQHVAIFTNLRDNARELQQSDTVISWDKNQPLSISDPHHYFGPVTISTTQNGNKLELDYTITFANPMAKSDIAIRAWSANLYSSDTYVLDAWQAVADSTTPAIPSTPQTTQTTPQPMPATPQTTQNEITPPQDSSSDILSAIKDWGGYSSHPISDSELLQSMNINDAISIPGWVSKTTKWVADGSTSPQEFQAAISYLHQVYAIK